MIIKNLVCIAMMKEKILGDEYYSGMQDFT